MKAWVIKTKYGYAAKWGDHSKLNAAVLFTSKTKAKREAFRTLGELPICVEITVIAKGKVK